MKIICFYWKGDRWKESPEPSPLYNNLIKRVGTVDGTLAAQYINNLYQGVRRNTDQEHEFICFTNEKLKLNPGIQTCSFTMPSVMGVLPRMYMFSEQSGLFGDQVLCIDIDVIIVGNLKPLLDYSGRFCARSKFLRGQEHKLDGDIMSFQAGPENCKLFWEPFEKDPKMVEQISQGRERYWVRHVADDWAERWDKVAPGTVLSYKRHIRNKGIPKDGVIVSCHGHPRPHQLPEGELKNKWNNVD